MQLIFRRGIIWSAFCGIGMFLTENGFILVNDGKPRQGKQLISRNVAIYAMQGRRPHMEDRFDVQNFPDGSRSFFAIYDGHGGEKAADFVKAHLLSSLVENLYEMQDCHPQPDGDGDAGCGGGGGERKMITDTFLEADRRLNLELTIAGDMSGSTAMVVVVSNGRVTAANVGDSRGILFTHDNQLYPLSFDHKPDNLDEKRRIERTGGFVAFNGVWRLLGVLATSRAFGDTMLKDTGSLTAEPEILSLDFVPLDLSVNSEVYSPDESNAETPPCPDSDDCAKSAADESTCSPDSCISNGHLISKKPMTARARTDAPSDSGHSSCACRQTHAEFFPPRHATAHPYNVPVCQRGGDGACDPDACNGVGQPRFLIIASDGLWDVFSNMEAALYIRDHLHESDYGAKSLSMMAYSRGSMDNIAVMVVIVDEGLFKAPSELPAEEDDEDNDESGEMVNTHDEL